jgi:hypothetical protein
VNLAAGGGCGAGRHPSIQGGARLSWGGGLVAFGAVLGHCGRLVGVAFGMTCCAATAAVEVSAASSGQWWWSRSLGCRGRHRVHAQ